MEQREKKKKKKTLWRITATDQSTLVVNIYEGRCRGIHHQPCSSDERVGSGASGDNMTNIQQAARGHSLASILRLWLNSSRHAIAMNAGFSNSICRLAYIAFDSANGLTKAVLRGKYFSGDHDSWLVSIAASLSVWFFN